MFIHSRDQSVQLRLVQRQVDVWRPVRAQQLKCVAIQNATPHVAISSGAIDDLTSSWAAWQFFPDSRLELLESHVAVTTQRERKFLAPSALYTR
jgi:hypothetical protein